jgi:hypothetical protein
LYCLEHEIGGPLVTSLVGHLRSHQIYKQAYVLTRKVGEERRRELVERYHLSPKERRHAEDDIARAVRLKPGQLILYCPAFGMQLKEADVRIKVDEGAPRQLSTLTLPELQILKERHQDLWKLYVFVAPEVSARISRISQACERYFSEPNHLAALQGAQMYLQF